MSSLQPQHTGGPSHHKVAIPRQDRRNEPPRKPSTIRQSRVSRACLSCRARKIRCNGAQPTCLNCKENVTDCVYASSRKDRLKTATEHNEEMMEFLKVLRTSVTDTERKKIDELIGDVNEDIADAATTFRKGQASGKARASETEGEALVSAEVGSNEDLDNMNEDILQNEQTRATGFLGKNSEIQWLRQIDHETQAASQGGPINEPFGPPGNNAEASKKRAEALEARQERAKTTSLQTSNFNFYLDNESVDMDFVVNPYELPPLEIADRLVRCYMDTVQPSFPILAKKIFINQFYHYYAAVARGTPYKLPQKWQAMLNLVFAIGAAFSHLTESDWRADERDHFLYHARAWELSIKDPWWFSHPDLPQTQITGLLAVYYLAIGHANRAWVITGMAIRFGFALGLHIRNEDRAATAVKKELLSRTWWGIYNLECLLSSLTGRPSVGIEIHCSVYLPLPISCDEIDEDRIKALFGDDPRPSHTEELLTSESASNTSSGVPDFEKIRRGPANDGTYLKCIVKLGQIQQKILTSLYSQSVITESWKDVQDTILGLNGEIELWAASIPPGLSFLNSGKEKPMAYEQNILLLHYRSTTILVNRPCLCRLDRRIPNQTQSSSEFNQRMALSCVNSAKAITAGLPDDMVAESIRIYQLFPWWSVVHYIMQSIAILMLEISYDAVLRSERAGTIASMKKLVRWLRILRENNGMARRAYTIVLELLQKMVVQTNIDISDLLEEHKAQNAPSADYDSSSFSGLYTQPPFGQENLEQYMFQDTFLNNPNRGGIQTNLFFTGYDQQNSFPFGGDVNIENYQEHYGGTGHNDGGENNGGGRYQW